MVHSLITPREMKQINCLEFKSSIELAFYSCLTGATKMKFKEISGPVKEAITGLQEQPNAGSIQFDHILIVLF